MKKKICGLFLLLLVLTAMIALPTEAASKGKWIKNSLGIYYAYNGSKLIKNKWVGDYYATADGSMAKDTWVTSNGKRFFVGADGKYIPDFKGGWYKIGKYYYYYLSDGTKKTGWLVIGKKTYYLIPEKNGKRAKGWKLIDGNKYYFSKSSSTNHMLKGWQTINQKRYYFNKKTGAAAKGFTTIGKNKYYFNDFYQKVTGWQTIDGKRYFFDSKGIMQTGWKTNPSKTKKYYLNPETGAAAVGLFSVDRVTYYFNTNGVMQKDKAVTVGGTVYNIDSAGKCTATVNSSAVAVNDTMLFFTRYESGTAAYAQVGGDHGNACGKYQFDYRYSLLPFVKYCYEKDSVFFAEFKTYAEYTLSQKSKLQNNTKFYAAWRTIYNKSPKGFAAYQDAFAKQEYYDVTERYLLSSFTSDGYSLNLSNRSEVIKGAVFSYSIQHGQWSAAAAVKAAGIKNSTSDTNFIKKLYAYRIKKYPAYTSRYTSEMELALSLI